MKILHLTLNKKWFDLIASGEKKIEYREGKPYWEKRLFKNNGLAQFNEIHFRNGYRKNAPFMRVQFVGLMITHASLCHPEHGEELKPDTKYFLIMLGDVLEVRR